MRTRAPLSLLGPLKGIIVHLNELQIIENDEELSDLEYLASKTECTKYLQIANTCTSRLLWPFKWHYSRLK